MFFIRAYAESGGGYSHLTSSQKKYQKEINEALKEQGLNKKPRKRGNPVNQQGVRVRGNS